MIRVKVEGRAELERRLVAYGDEALKQVDKALAKGASDLVKIATRLAPDNPNTTQGDIRRSFVIESYKTDQGAPGYMVKNYARHAAYQEFGTEKTDAQPYFFPGYRLVRKKIFNRVTRAIRMIRKGAL